MWSVCRRDKGRFRNRLLIAALGVTLSLSPIAGADVDGQSTVAAQSASDLQYGGVVDGDLQDGDMQLDNLQLEDTAFSVQDEQAFAEVAGRSSMPSRAQTRRMRRAAVRRARRAIGHRRHWRHMCLSFVRSRYHLPRRQRTAYRAWRAAHHKHRHDRRPPAGVPVFWSGGSRDMGHIAISLGHGWIITTDLPRAGHVTRVRLSTISRRWGLHYLGWTEDLEGFRIYRR